MYQYGVFNLLASILPKRIVKILQFMGFKADKEAGLDALKEVSTQFFETSSGCSAALSSFVRLGFPRTSPMFTISSINT